MSDVPEELLSRVLALPDDKFYEEDRALLAEREKLAGKMRFEGLALACPARLSDSRLPLLLLAVQTARRIAEVRPYDNRIVVAAPLGRGPVSFGPYHPRQPPTKKPLPRPPRELPDDDPYPATSLSLTLFDVSPVLAPALPGTGRAAVRVIEWDRTSNTVTTVLGSAEPEEPVDARYRLQDAAAYQLAVRETAARFARSDASPELEGEGLALALPYLWPVSGEGVVIHGAVRTAVDEGALVDPQPRDRGEEELARRQAELPRAILAGALLLVRQGSIAPTRIDFTVPIYRKEPLQAGEVVEGWFSIDLPTTLHRPLVNVEHCVYGISGPHTLGPRRVIVQT